MLNERILNGHETKKEQQWQQGTFLIPFFKAKS
jgi:hypothetical protein